MGRDLTDGDLADGDLAALCPEAHATERARWCGQLAEYAELLRRWGRRMNLVAEGDLPYLASRHLAPALRLRPLLRSLPHARILDVGSGGGLPAIPLKIALPDAAMTLVESRRRRCSFLREAVRTLGLEHVEVRNQRLEGSGLGGGLPDDMRHTVATLRAVAVTPELTQALRPWMAPGAFLVSTLPPGGSGAPIGCGPDLLMEGGAGDEEGRHDGGPLGAAVGYGLWRL